jgi:hypothetical protein
VSNELGPELSSRYLQLIGSYCEMGD